MFEIELAPTGDSITRGRADEEEQEEDDELLESDPEGGGGGGGGGVARERGGGRGGGRQRLPQPGSGRGSRERGWLFKRGVAALQRLEQRVTCCQPSPSTVPGTWALTCELCGYAATAGPYTVFEAGCLGSAIALGAAAIALTVAAYLLLSARDKAARAGGSTSTCLSDLAYQLFGTTGAVAADIALGVGHMGFCTASLAFIGTGLSDIFAALAPIDGIFIAFQLVGLLALLKSFDSRLQFRTVGRWSFLGGLLLLSLAILVTQTQPSSSSSSSSSFSPFSAPAPSYPFFSPSQLPFPTPPNATYAPGGAPSANATADGPRHHWEHWRLRDIPWGVNVAKIPVACAVWVSALSGIVSVLALPAKPSSGRAVWKTNARVEPVLVGPTVCAMAGAVAYHATTTAVLVASIKLALHGRGDDALGRLVRGGKMGLGFGLGCTATSDLYALIQTLEFNLLGPRLMRARDPRALACPVLLGLLRLLLLLAAALLAALLPRFAALFALTGAVGGAVVCTVLPVCCHATAAAKDNVRFGRLATVLYAMPLGAVLALAGMAVRGVCAQLSEDEGWGLEQLRKGGVLIKPRW